MKPGIASIAIGDLVLHDRCQARSSIDPEALDDYAELYKADPSRLPPIAVFEVDGKPYVVDGFHRVTAAIKVGLGFIRCRVVGQGGLEDAVWFATSVNQDHGLRRTNLDKRKAIVMALESGIGSEQSSRVLAEHIGVSHMTVSRVRAEWEAARQGVTKLQLPKVQQTDTLARDQAEPDHVSLCYTSEPSQSDTSSEVIGKDGKRYPKRALPKDPFGEIAGLVQALRKTIRERFGEHQTIDRHLEAAWRYADDKTSIDCARCDGGGCARCDLGRLTKAEERAHRERARSRSIAKGQP